MPRVDATTRCTASMVWVAECTVMVPPSSGTATAAWNEDGTLLKRSVQKHSDVLVRGAE